MVDSGGLPVYYELWCGNTHDIVHGESLVANSPTSKTVVADKAYDSEKLSELFVKITLHPLFHLRVTA